VAFDSIPSTTPVAAVLLIPWLLKEGREAFFGEEEEQEEIGKNP
jgi:hypothetical protein